MNIPGGQSPGWWSGKLIKRFCHCSEKYSQIHLCREGRIPLRGTQLIPGFCETTSEINTILPLFHFKSLFTVQRAQGLGFSSSPHSCSYCRSSFPLSTLGEDKQNPEVGRSRGGDGALPLTLPCFWPTWRLNTLRSVSAHDSESSSHHLFLLSSPLFLPPLFRSLPLPRWDHKSQTHLHTDTPLLLLRCFVPAVLQVCWPLKHFSGVGHTQVIQHSPNNSMVGKKTYCISSFRPNHLEGGSW